MEYKVETNKTGTETIKTVKIGDTTFRVDNFKPKTKDEFVKLYKPFKQKVEKNGKTIEETVNPWSFNRDEAWDFLKQFVVQPKK